MRTWTGLLGIFAVAGALALSTGTANAQDWCGFHQTQGSRVRCGYTSVQHCKQALTDQKDGDKTVTCLPDPFFG
jgi:hypothetical protein